MRAQTCIVTLLTTPVSNAWHPLNYAFDPRIHKFGNHGLLGKMHARLAPYFTKMIDNAVYRGVDIRENIIEREGKNKTFLDIGCGAGFSTSTADVVFPEMRNRHSVASISFEPSKILTVNKNENNSLSFSKSDRQTFTYT